MRKASKRSRRQATDRSATVDVVSQLECAIRRPQATLIGALVGGLVPWFARTLAHEQLPATWSSNHALAGIMLAVILGCAVFSGLTVYKFGRATFGDKRKAIGFTLALEGVMLVSSGATSAVALATLVAINALANGSAIALARDATCKRREATARAAATRRAGKQERDHSRTPIEVVQPQQPQHPQHPQHPQPQSRAAARYTPARAMAKAPGRILVVTDDVIDAEIVSEQRLLA